MDPDYFVKLCRVVIHDDPDMLDATYVALHLNGRTSWKKGRYFGRSGVYSCIASPDLNDINWWDTASISIVNKFGCKTLGRMEAKYFTEEDADGVSV